MNLASATLSALVLMATTSPESTLGLKLQNTHRRRLEDASDFPCPTGSVVSGLECNLCPPGTFSDMPGSTFCTPCATTVYDGPGANAAEFWNGQLRCILPTTNGSDETDVDGDNESTVAPTSTSAPSPTLAPTRIRIVGDELPSATPSLAPSGFPTTTPSVLPSDVPSALPSALPSSFPSDSPSSAPSSLPTGSDTEAPTNVQDTELIVQEASSACSSTDDEDNSFEWHGRCRSCPSKLEAAFYPFVILLLLASLVTTIESIIPMCSTTLVWIGIEYLQLLYLSGIASPLIPWSQVANLVFTNVLPLFALDLNAAVSLQCIFGWSRQSDNVAFLALPPMIYAILLLLAKLFKGRVACDRSTSRWMAVLLYVGYVQLVLTSFETMKCDSGSSWVGCTGSLYASIAGIVGLIIYGLAFPLWFLRAIYRYAKYQMRVTTDHDKDVETSDGIHSQQESDNDLSHDNLFFLLGVFPQLQPGTWWWSGVWMARKAFFALLSVFFYDSPILLLIVFVLVLLLSEILQRCFSPLEITANLPNAERNTIWAHASKVDTVLQISLVAIAGLGFLALSESAQNVNGNNWAVDTLVLVVLIPSLVYWLAAIVFSSRTINSSRFQTRALVLQARAHEKSANAAISLTGPNLELPSVNGSVHFAEFSFSSSSTSSSRGPSDGATPSSAAANLAIPPNLSMLPGVGSSDQSSVGGQESPMGSTILHSLNEDALTEWQNTQDFENFAMTKTSLVTTRLRTPGSLSAPPSFEDNVDEDVDDIDDESSARPSSGRQVFRDDSILTFDSTNHGEDEEDMATVIEEVFIDERTGLPVDASNGRWADASTGQHID